MLPQPNNFPSSSTSIKCSSIHKHKNMSCSKCPFLKMYLVPTKIPLLTYPSTEEVTKAFLSLNCSSEVDGFCPHLKEVKVYDTAEGKILYQIASPCRASQHVSSHHRSCVCQLHKHRDILQCADDFGFKPTCSTTRDKQAAVKEDQLHRPQMPQSMAYPHNYCASSTIHKLL